MKNKYEKKKLSKRTKENSKKHRQIEELKKMNRKLEQEFEMIKKDKNSNLWKVKLNKINEIRMQLGLEPKEIKDFKAKEIKSERDEIDLEESDSDDFTNIPMPSGRAPETQGQIFYALKIPQKTCKNYSTEAFTTKVGEGKIAKKEQKEEIKVPQKENFIPPKDSGQSSVVISAAPVMRDLRKELVGMVPHSVRRK
jgi:glucan-binding YG repeat protein